MREEGKENWLGRETRECPGTLEMFCVLNWVVATRGHIYVKIPIPLRKQWDLGYKG